MKKFYVGLGLGALVGWYLRSEREWWRWRMGEYIR